MKKQGTKITPKTISIVNQCTKIGLTDTQIGRALNLHRTTVYKIRQENDFDRPMTFKRNYPVGVQEYEAVGLSALSLKNEGHTDTNIRSMLKLTKRQLQTMRIDFNIPRTRRKS